MTPLDYLKTKGREATDVLCQQAGTTLGYFEQIAYGFRRPSVELARRLESASGGDLVAVDMVFAPVRQPGERTAA